MDPLIPAIRKGRPPGSKNKPKKRRVKPAPARDAEKGTTRIYATGQGTFLPLEPLSDPAPPPRPARVKEYAPPAEHPKGYTRVYVDDTGKELAVPVDEPTPAKPPAPQLEPVEVVEVAIPSDADQRQMIDEFGELSRQLQMHAPLTARHEVLKKAIKSWFASVPPDADGSVEGSTYRLHITARERERRVRDPRELMDRIGIDKFLEIAVVPVTALQRLMGTMELEALLVETRSGSRRIRCIPKFPAVPPR